MTILSSNNDCFDPFCHLYLFHLLIHSAGVSPPPHVRTVSSPARERPHGNGSVSVVSPTPAFG